MVKKEEDEALEKREVKKESEILEWCVVYAPLYPSSPVSQSSTMVISPLVHYQEITLRTSIGDRSKSHLAFL